MKKVIFYASLCSLLAIGCTSKTEKRTPFEKNLDSVKLIVSIPDWALGVTLNSTANSSNCLPLLDSLKKLRTFQVFLDTTLLKKAKGTYVLSRKINPCCPCTTDGNDCCPCQGGIILASPSSMQVTISFQNAAVTPTTPIAGIDYFNVPNAVQGSTLVIQGRGIPAPLNFVY